MSSRRIALTALSILIVPISLAGAAPTDAEKCESGKLKEAGKYGFCRLKAESKGVKKAQAPDFTKCDEKFGNKWGKLEGKFASECPTLGDALTITDQATSYADSIASLLAGTPEQARCEAGKLKQAGKYSFCRLKAESKGVKKAEVPDFTKCDEKITLNWGKLETKFAPDCPTAGTSVVIAAATGLDLIVSEAIAHTDAVTQLLSGVPACGDGVVNQPSEECDGADSATCSAGCGIDCLCEPCTGTEAGGFCWFPSSLGQNCDGTCAAVGLSCSTAGTIDYVGTGGTDANCVAVLNAAGVDTSSFFSGPCTFGIGCGADSGFIAGRCTSPATTCAAADPGLYRICACEIAAPTCGDGVINQPSETCDGADDAACPGNCQIDCLCPAPTCGDGVINQASEECDGDKLGTCSVGCGSDCMCLTCTGTEVGGSCWFYSSFGASCNGECAARALQCSDATRTYAGSDGTTNNCLDVLNALGVSTTSFLGDVTLGSSGLGCVGDTSGNTGRDVGSSTTCEASDGILARTCACRAPVCGCAPGCMNTNPCTGGCTDSVSCLARTALDNCLVNSGYFGSIEDPSSQACTCVAVCNALPSSTECQDCLFGIEFYCSAENAAYGAACPIVP